MGRIHIPIGAVELVSMLLLVGCASGHPPNLLPRSETIQPTELRPVSGCAVFCAGGAPMLFAPQHLCSRGANRQLQDIQIIAVRADHWVVCGRYDYARRRCELGREIDKTDVELMLCDQLKAVFIGQRESSERGRDGGVEFARPHQPGEPPNR